MQQPQLPSVLQNVLSILGCRLNVCKQLLLVFQQDQHFVFVTVQWNTLISKTKLRASMTLRKVVFGISGQTLVKIPATCLFLNNLVKMSTRTIDNVFGSRIPVFSRVIQNMVVVIILLLTVPLFSNHLQEDVHLLLLCLENLQS
jgi:hypothetical protein